MPTQFVYRLSNSPTQPHMMEWISGLLSMQWLKKSCFYILESLSVKWLCWGGKWNKTKKCNRITVVDLLLTLHRGHTSCGCPPGCDWQWGELLPCRPCLFLSQMGREQRGKTQLPFPHSELENGSWLWSRRHGEGHGEGHLPKFLIHRYFYFTTA